jgi:hypothetical protein
MVSFQNRISFSARQAFEFQSSGSALSASNPINAALVMIYQLLFAPPAYYDTLNYAAQLSSSIAVYQNSFLPVGFSGAVWSVLSLILIIFGFFPVKQAENHSIPSRMKIRLLITGMGILLLMLIAVPIGFQRYYVMLYPFLGLMLGYGIENCISAAQRSIKE